jgi:hypothetical protein
MKGIKLKYTEQEKDLINSSIIEGNKMGEIIEKVLKISPTRTSDAVYHIVRKLRNQLKGENVIASKSMYFYTEEQIKTLTDAINSGESLLQIAKRLHTSFNRTEHNLYVKLMKLNYTHKNVVNNKDKKKLVFYTNEQVEEMTSMLQGENVNIAELSRQLSIKYNKNIHSVAFKLNVLKKKLKLTKPTEVDKVEPVRSLATIRAKRKLQDSKPVVEQKPAEIGIEVPHGMTFEGKPKKIMLHSDHFRIYF